MESKDLKALDSKDLRYCVFDLETTGLNVDTSGIVQLAFKIVIKNKIVAKENIYIYPRGIDWSDEKVQDALRINHLTEDALADCGQEEKDVLKEFYRLLEHYKVDYICGQNIANYDLLILNKRLKFTEYVRNMLVLDTKLLSYIYSSLEKHSLVDLATMFKVRQVKAHCAADDVSVTERVLRAMLRKWRVFRKMPMVKNLWSLEGEKDGCVWTKKKYCLLPIDQIRRTDEWYYGKFISPSGGIKEEQTVSNVNKVCDDICSTTRGTMIKNFANLIIKQVIKRSNKNK